MNVNISAINIHSTNMITREVIIEDQRFRDGRGDAEGRGIKKN